MAQHDITYVVNENFSAQLKKSNNTTPMRRSFNNVAKIVKTVGDKSSSSIKIGETSSSSLKAGNATTGGSIKGSAVSSPMPLDLSEIPGVVNVEEEDGNAHQATAGVGVNRDVAGSPRLKATESPKSKNASWNKESVAKSQEPKSPRNKSLISLVVSDESVESVASEIWQSRKPKSPSGGHCVTSLMASEPESKTQAQSLTSSGSKKDAIPSSCTRKDGASDKDAGELDESMREALQASGGSRKDVVVTYTVNENFSLAQHPKPKAEESAVRSSVNITKMMKVMSRKGIRDDANLNVNESDFVSSGKGSHFESPLSKGVDSPRQSRKLVSPRGKSSKAIDPDELDSKAGLKNDDYLDFAVKKDKGTLNKIIDFFAKKE